MAPADPVAFNHAAAVLYKALEREEKAQRAAFAKDRTERAHMSNKSASFTAESLDRAIETGVLVGTVPIEFEKGEIVTVQELLTGRGAEVDGRVCHDPLEPDYRPGTMLGRFYWNNGEAPCIHSMAHGGHTFILRYEPGAAGTAATVVEALRILVLTVYATESEAHADERAIGAKFKTTISALDRDMAAFVTRLRERGINFRASGKHQREFMDEAGVARDRAAEAAMKHEALDIADLKDGATILAQLTAHWRVMLSSNGAEAICFRNASADPRVKLLKFRQFTKRALIDFCERFPIIVGDVRLNPARMWFDGAARSAKMVTFDPGAPPVPGIVNLWTGFAVQPGDPNGCPRILLHIREVIASGDPVIEKYLLDWLALRVQGIARRSAGPLPRMQVAIVMRSDPGTGKGLFERAVHGMFGDVHGLMTANGSGLIGRFNSEFANKVMLCADEAFFAGDAKGHSLLKSFLDPNFSFEQKFKDSISLPNHVAVLMSTNANWAVPADAGDRRMCVLDVSAHRVGDTSYFEALAREIEHGDGSAHLLAHLLARDITDFNVNDYPKTAALLEQKHMTIGARDATMAWLMEALSSAALPQWTPAGFGGVVAITTPWPTDKVVPVEKEAIREAVAKVAHDTRQFHGAPSTMEIGAKLKSALGGGEALPTRRPRMHMGEREERDRPRCWEFPPLDIARERHRRPEAAHRVGRRRRVTGGPRRLTVGVGRRSRGPRFGPGPHQITPTRLCEKLEG